MEVKGNNSSVNELVLKKLIGYRTVHGTIHLYQECINMTNRYLGMVLEGWMDRRIRYANTISLRLHRGKTSTKQRIKWRAQERNTVFQVKLELVTPGS